MQLCLDQEVEYECRAVRCFVVAIHSVEMLLRLDFEVLVVAVDLQILVLVLV